jgi:hypothetical protein
LRAYTYAWSKQRVSCEAFYLVVPRDLTQIAYEHSGLQRSRKSGDLLHIVKLRD